MPVTNRDTDTDARRAIMALCAAATTDELSRALTGLGAPEAEDLRAPEIGLVMATGRIGGDGRPFNLGEVSVTRAAVRLTDGGPASPTTSAATAAAPGRPRSSMPSGRRPARRRGGLGPRRPATGEEAAAEARRTAATRVDFLTLARGED